MAMIIYNKKVQRVELARNICDIIVTTIIWSKYVNIEQNLIRLVLNKKNWAMSEWSD